MGRPTSNPKNHEISARVDDETLEILNEYCQMTKQNRAQSIRNGIHKLKEETNKRK